VTLVLPAHGSYFYSLDWCRLNASSTSDEVNLVSQALTAKAATMAAVKKYLLSIGWDLAWIDGVTAEIMKRKLETNADQCKAVVEYLTGELNIPNRRLENMVSICKGILGKTPTELKDTVDFIQSKGIDGDDLLKFLSSNPVVLSYSVSPSKEYLEKGKARMTLVLVQGKEGAQVPSIVQWREGAAFSTAPMSPNLPSKST